MKKRGASRLAALWLAVGWFGAALAQKTAVDASSFDVVSVHVNKTGSDNSSLGTNNESFRSTNVPLKALIQAAYGLMTADLIAGLPGWAESSRFDIQTQVGTDDLIALKAMPEHERSARHELMLQAMLADRFHLALHRETKESPMYALVVARSGPRMTRADPAQPHGSNLNLNNQSLSATSVTMDHFCGFLSQHLHRKVENRTALTADYDFALQWSADEAAGESPATTGAAGFPSLFTALQEQLGLKLESTKGPVEMIVVDHVEMPSEN